ncbi:HD domain-containing phosphohydrolase [Propionivibrio soli]|uniref:HD domain-containing phosphohydrolase n=1 Tax=Propionivibrio soli TaxID=2976531 RepID=UPI0021E87144|nr:HD domain-containing phosphohydrolase [Propionivibrio soli]
MDIRSIIAPAINDKVALEEFVESLNDQAPNIERAIARLKSDPADHEVISALFRSIHNVKGDATLCKVDFAVAIAHPIETLLARFRNGEIVFSDILAEAILLAIDRLELAAEGLFAGRSLENLRLLVLVQGLEKMAMAAPAAIDENACELIEAVTGFRPATEAAAQIRGRAPTASSKSSPQGAEDLRFFRTLADQLEARSPLFKGRTTRLLRLSLETNVVRKKVVDPVQLEAAVYMHDIGMMFLPESVWLKVERMTPEEQRIMRAHPEYSAGILSRMEGWADAAQMVAQHHEMPDGAGYPSAIGAAEICDGAKILAIVDAFEAVMLKHINRGRNRSVLRAIAEINACNNQFAPEWIEPFNQVIRRTVEA